MDRVTYRVAGADVLDFDPKKGLAKIKVTFYKNDLKADVVKEYTFGNAILFVADLLKDVKKKDSLLLADDDDIFSGYQVVALEKEEEIEEQLSNFFRRLNEKFKNLRLMKNAYNYMKLYDDIKVSRVQIIR